MTVKLFTRRIPILLIMLFSGYITPVVAQNLDGLKQIITEGFEPQVLPMQTDWGMINSFGMPRKRNLSVHDKIMQANNIKPIDQLEKFGFKKYLMSKDSTHACRFLVEIALFNSCPPIEVVFVNPQNITEFIIISKEIKNGYISKPHIEKTLLPGIKKKQDELTGEETDNGISATMALIEPPSFISNNVNPRIDFRTQIIVNNGADRLRYYDQRFYILTRNGHVGITILNTNFFEKELINKLVDRIIHVAKPNSYSNASMFDFNTSNINAEDFLLFD